MDKTSKIFKIFSGRATPEEVAEIEAWVKEDPAHLREFNDAKRFCAEAELFPRDEDERRRYDSLVHIQQKVQHAVRRKRRISSARWIGVLVVMVVSNGYLFGLLPLKNDENEGIRYENLTVPALLLEMEAEHGVAITGLPEESEARFVNVALYGFQGEDDLSEALARGLDEIMKEGKGPIK